MFKHGFIENYTRLFRNFIFIKILFPLFVRKKKMNKKHYLSICAVFKNEAKYFKEWIEYYQIVGINHFYLYNNDSTDNYKKVLKPYIDQGIVTLIEWPGPSAQMPVYHDCLKRFSDESNWIGFIDLDEFICPIKQNSLPEWIKQFERFPSVYVFWKLFASNGLMQEDENKLLSEQLFLSAPISHDSKFFFNTDWTNKIKQFKTPHVIRLKLWGLVVPQYARLLFLRNSIPDDKLEIQMNHYFSKNYEYFVKKKIPGGLVLKKEEAYHLDCFYKIENWAYTPDYKIFKYMVKLKLRMQGKDI